MVHGVMHMYVMSFDLHVCLTYFDFALIASILLISMQEDPNAVNKAILDFANEVHGL